MNNIRIHCFESDGIEGCPSNTYQTNDIDKAVTCIKDLLINKSSGISRILIENPKFESKECYKNIVSNSPINL